jgi:hypothetical protein
MREIAAEDCAETARAMALVTALALEAAVTGGATAPPAPPETGGSAPEAGSDEPPPLQEGPPTRDEPGRSAPPMSGRARRKRFRRRVVLFEITSLASGDVPHE